MADLTRVHEINEASVPEVGAASLDRLAFIVDESDIALVTEVDDVVVGFVLVLAPGSTYDSVNYRWFMDRFDDAMYLDRVALDASARGRGLGSELYEAVDTLIGERRAGGARCSHLTLEVNVDPPNEPSLRFHSKLGFDEVGRQMSHGIEVSLMRRPLV